MTSVRSLSELEISVLNQLLNHPFQGANELRLGMQDLKAEPLDADGSLKLIAPETPPADVRLRVPVEGEVEDVDGVTIHVLLHVVEGRLSELEIFKDDGSVVKNREVLRNMRVF